MTPRLPLALLPLLFGGCTETCLAGSSGCGPEERIDGPAFDDRPRAETGPTRLALEEDGSLVLEHLGEVRLVLPPGAIQVGTVDTLDPNDSYDPWWLVHSDALFTPSPPPDLVFRSGRVVAYVAAPPGSFAVTLDFGAGVFGQLTVTPVGSRVELLVEVVQPEEALQIAYVRLRVRPDPTEGLYGLGEWPDRAEHRGTLRAMQLELDPAVESANNEAHVPVPLLTGTTGWALFVPTDRPAVFDVAATDPTIASVTIGTAQPLLTTARFELWTADHPLDLLAAYYEATALPTLPAPWAYGPWIWRNEHRDQAEVEDDVATIRRLDLPTSAIWIDRPYATAVSTPEFDPQKFPAPDAMIATILAAGLQLALWHTPYLEEGAGPLRAEADASHYFPPEHGVLLNGWSPPLDLTNPEAVAFWQRSVKPYVERGVRGFKLDFSEDVLPGAFGARSGWRFFDGSDESTMHHHYTRLYHRTYAELLPEEAFLLCRAGKWGTQRYPCVIWPGDMDASFSRFGETFTNRDGERIVGAGGLPATVVQGISLGASGFPFFGADTGGYRHSPPDEELFVRWMQQTAFSTVMQVGDASSQPPWIFTAENGRTDATVDLYRTFARWHLRLFPYIWSHAHAIATTGRPILRAVGQAYPELDAHPSDEYLLGDDLLVAPVLERGATSRTVLLPPGRWVSFWDGAELHGPGEVTVETPRDTIPVFLREGALLPLLDPAIDTLSPATDPGVDSFADTPGVLFVRVVPGADGAFTVFDGTRLIQTAGAITVAPGTTFRQGALLEVLERVAPIAVMLGSAELPLRSSAAEVASQGGWFHGGTPEATWIALPAEGGLVERVPPD